MSNARFCIIPARALGDKRITRNDIMVLNALGMYGDKEGWSFPSIGTIAELINAHRVSVSKSIGNLVACGYLESRARRRDDGGQTSNEYRILFDQPSLFDSHRNEPDHIASENTPIAPPLPPHSEAATPPIASDATPPIAHTLYHINEPNLTPQTKDVRPPKKYPQGFEDFWNLWPKDRRCEKPEAFKAWKEATAKIDAQSLMEFAALYAKSKDALEGFAPYPAKWLKRERWLEIQQESQPQENITLQSLGGDNEQNRQFMALLTMLEKEHGSAACKSWFWPLRVAEVKEKMVVFVAPTRFHRRWVLEKFGDSFKKCALIVFGVPPLLSSAYLDKTTLPPKPA
jgi:hypothetical protein